MPEQRPQIPPLTGKGAPGWDAAVEDKVNLLLQGKANVSAVLTVTLTANATSTLLTDERIGYFTHLSLEPRTASAATARADLWYETDAGSAILHHASNAATDQTFSYACWG